jgi:hypothetical protein
VPRKSFKSRNYDLPRTVSLLLFFRLMQALAHSREFAFQTDSARWNFQRSLDLGPRVPSGREELTGLKTKFLPDQSCGGHVRCHRERQ